MYMYIKHKSHKGISVYGVQVPTPNINVTPLKVQDKVNLDTLFWGVCNG